MIKILPLVNGGVWGVTYFINLALFIPFFVWRVKMPTVARLLLVYILVDCLFMIEWPSAHFGPYTQSFQSTAAQVFIEALLIPCIAIYQHQLVRRIIPILAVFSAACVWLKWDGFMHASSLNSALAAACIPALGGNPFIILFIVITALSHHGATALTIIAAQLAARLIKKRREIKASHAFGILLFAAPIIAILLLSQHEPVLNSGERLERWHEYMRFWASDWHRILLGTMPGSFIWYSILSFPCKTGFYLQMHNDWLQILWENGVVGLALVGGVCREAVKRAWAREDLLSLCGVAGCMAFGLTYSPLRYFPSALLTAFYFARVLIIENVDI